VFVLSRIKRNRIKKSTKPALKESRPALVLKVKTLFYCVFVKTKMRYGREDVSAMYIFPFSLSLVEELIT